VTRIAGMQGSVIMQLVSELRVRIHLGGGKSIQGNYIVCILDALLPQAHKGLLRWVPWRVGNKTLVLYCCREITFYTFWTLRSLKHTKVYFAGCLRGLVIKLWSCTAVGKLHFIHSGRFVASSTRSSTSLGASEGW